LCAWSLKKLENDLGYETLTKNWMGDVELRVVVDKISETARGMEKTIIKGAGLSSKDIKYK
jgi:hypothetical protein